VIIVIIVAFTGMVYADRNIPAAPEIQGLTTATGMGAQGMVTETDSLAWTITASPDGIYTNSQEEYRPGQNPIAIGPPLTFDQVQYTTGYNSAYSGVSGQTSFTKSMGISTADQIATGNNVNANTNVQFIAVDAGRATNSEDLLLDGAENSTDTENAILCPFGQPSDLDLPAYCNIVEAGSSFDSTLTSTVTKANDRFVGTDSTIPVSLNYNIASTGITAGNSSSPMIGSAAAYLKVHIQEARNWNESYLEEYQYPSSPKSEDVAYTETSTASGLISNFAKSVSYSSQFSPSDAGIQEAIPG
jgi:hypothetical protein